SGPKTEVPYKDVLHLFLPSGFDGRLIGAGGTKTIGGRSNTANSIAQCCNAARVRIVQCKMSMKPELIPMQHEHETGCGGMLRPDAINDAECRTFEPRANPGVSGIERRNRVRRARARRDICVDRTRCGSARIRATQQEGARADSCVHRKNDGTEPGTNHAADPDV